MFKKTSVYSLSILLTSALCYFFVFDHLPKSQSLVLSCLIIAMGFWILELLPLYVTGFFISFILIVSGEFTPKEIFDPYFDSTIVLFFGGFILALGLQKQGLDKRIAQFIIKKSGKKPSQFLLALMLVTAFLSMWMSNTAATAIMLPIALSLLSLNSHNLKSSHLSKMTVLAVAYSSTLGGIATLVGSPPNAIAAKYMRDSGTEISFLSWLIKSLPFVLACLFLTWKILVHRIRNENSEISIPIEESPPLSLQQKQVIFVFIITVLAWLTTPITGITAATASLIPLLLFSFLKIINEKDIHSISWGTLLLFGGGLSLGGALIKSGADKVLIHSTLTLWQSFNPLALVFALSFFAIIATMVISNTASAAILIPMLLPMSTEIGFEPTHLIYLIAVGVSLDFMMPMGTPPSAIAYSTGLLKVKEMVKMGALVNIATGFLLALYVYLF